MYQFSSACTQIERRVGEGALSESFFLIKDGIGEDCGLVHLVCRISSIPAGSPLRAGEPLRAFCFTSSAEFTRGSGPAPWCCIQCNTSCIERRCECPLLPPPDSRTAQSREKTYDNFLTWWSASASRGQIRTNQHWAALADAKCCDILRLSLYLM